METIAMGDLLKRGSVLLLVVYTTLLSAHGKISKFIMIISDRITKHHSTALDKHRKSVRHALCGSNDSYITV